MENEPSAATTTRRSGGNRMAIVIAVIVVIVAAAGFLAYKKGWLPFGSQNKTVATVNGEAIKEREVNIRLNQLKPAYQQQGINLNDPAKALDIKRQIVQEIVNEDLVLQQAKVQGITVSDDDIQKTLTQLQTNMGGAEAVNKQLQQFGMSKDDLKTMLQRNLILQKFIDKYAVDQNITVSDQEIAKAYQDATQGKVSSTTPALKDVKDQLGSQLKQQKVAQKVLDLINQLKAKAQIKVLI